MTRIPNNQDLEKLFKTSFENFEPEVNVDVWNKIQQNIPKSALQGAAITSVLGKLGSKLLIGAGAVATAIATIVYLSTINKTSAPTASAKAVKTITSQAIVPATASEQKIPVTATDNITTATKINNKHFIVKTEKKQGLILEPEVKLQVNENKQETKNTINPVSAISTPASKQAQAEETIDQPVINNNTTTKVIAKQDHTKDPAINNTTATGSNARPSIAATSHSGVFPLTITFSSRGGNNISKWDFGDGTFSTEKTPVHTYEKVGIYKVVLTSEDDVKDVQFIQVLSNIKVSAPNFFSPDGDGINDEFRVTSDDAESLHVQILDLAGKEVGRIESQEGTWDGKSIRSGELCKAGTYLYIVSGTTIDGKQFEHRGSLTLKR